jgi:hypothetical protein
VQRILINFEKIKFFQSSYERSRGTGKTSRYLPYSVLITEEQEYSVLPHPANTPHLVGGL